MTIIADWRKTNWCRMNLYIRNEGLMAPCNGDPNQYEAFQMEALQFFGTPNEILNEVTSYGQTASATNQAGKDTAPQVYPNPFSSVVSISGIRLQNEEIKMHAVSGVDVSNAIAILSKSNTEVILETSNLLAGLYFLQIGTSAHKVYKQ